MAATYGTAVTLATETRGEAWGGTFPGSGRIRKEPGTFGGGVLGALEHPLAEGLEAGVVGRGVGSLGGDAGPS